MAEKKIVIIEDDEDIVEMITYNLRLEGYHAVAVAHGDDAISFVQQEAPQMIILDWMLPGLDGIDVCRMLRENAETKHIPIIMLTAKSQEVDKVLGLEMGTDDYMTKPFSPRELLARIKAVMRRYHVADVADDSDDKAITIDTLKHSVRVFGKKIALTKTEFALLTHFMSKPGRVFSREQLLNAVFGYDAKAYDRVVDAHIKSLRKKLGAARTYIETVRGIGYRFKEEAHEE